MERIKHNRFPSFFEADRYPYEPDAGNRLVLGTAGIGGMWRAIPAEEAKDVLLAALSEGVTAFDTAPAYGKSEKLLGQVLNKWRGKQPFVSTKVGRLEGKNAGDVYYDHSAKAMRQSVLRSLETLELKQIPLLFLHDPARVPVAERERVWETLLSFRAEGLARQIGLGGTIDEQWYSYLQKEKVDVLMEYNNLDAANLSAVNTTVPICDRENIRRYQASPLHNGLLGNQFEAFTKKPPAWITPYEVQQARRLNSISQKYSIPLDHLALRFVLSIDEVDRVVIGASTLSELSSSLTAFRAGNLAVARFYEICNGLI